MFWISLPEKGRSAMKAISIHPRFAMEIACRRKTVECRTWQTHYRGELLICASAKREPDCIAGHALAVCTLSSILPFSEAHLSPAEMDEMPIRPSYAWMLEAIRPIHPFPVKGRLGLFDVQAEPALLSESITMEELLAVFAPFCNK